MSKIQTKYIPLSVLYTNIKFYREESLKLRASGKNFIFTKKFLIKKINIPNQNYDKFFIQIQRNK